MSYLCIDIGGTKTLVCRVSDSGDIEEQIKFPTPTNYQQFLAELRENILIVKNEDTFITSVGAPGKIDHERGVGVAFGNLPWRNITIREDIATITNTEVLVENDAKLAGLAEAQHLKDKYSKILYVTISTGINMGLVVNGKLDETLSESEAGQMLVEHSGELITWEKLASGSSLVRKYGKQASDIDDPSIWEEFAHNLSLGLIDLIAIIQPDVIVLGGGVGTHYEKYRTQLHRALKRFENQLVGTPPIVKAVNPEHAVIFGGYELARSYAATSHKD